MTYLLLGFALLAIGVLIANTAQMASQAALVRWLKRIAIALAVLIGVFLLATGRLGQALPLLFLALGLVMRFRRLAGRAGASTASPGQSSRVETAWLRMVLDHDTGTMAGTVLQGRFAGSELAGLGVSDLIELYLDCLRADEPSARILETYLDRGPHAATWRHGMGDRDQEGERSQATSSAITIHEARDILGVSPLASSADIQAAHHRLMKFHHPDRGGSTYLAAKINAARDILLAAHQHSGEATR